MPVATSESIRERIMDFLVTTFSSMTEGSPVDDPYEITFSRVEREDMKELAKGKKYALSIFDEEETKEDDVSIQRATIRVVFEFLAYVDSTSKPLDVLNKVAKNVERRFMADQTCGGIAINCKITSIQYDSEYVYDKQARGTMFAIVQYRHKTGDPRKFS